MKFVCLALNMYDSMGSMGNDELLWAIIGSDRAGCLEPVAVAEQAVTRIAMTTVIAALTVALRRAYTVSSRVTEYEMRTLGSTECASSSMGSAFRHNTVAIDSHWSADRDCPTRSRSAGKATR